MPRRDPKEPAHAASSKSSTDPSIAPSGRAAPRRITDRQLEILVHVARGKTNRQIGEVLGLSERTVRNHMFTILRKLASADASAARSGRGAPRRMTDRQLEILTHVARGRTNRQIGEVLGLSERTVRNHMFTILRKLASADRTRAVVVAIERGWIAIPIQPELSDLRVTPEPVQPASGEDES